MIINLLFDSSVAAMPAAQLAAVQYAANFYEAWFTNPITVNLAVGYGEIGGIPMDNTQSLGRFNYVQTSYSALKPKLAAQDGGAVLPATDPTGGAGVYVPNAVAKALGIISPTASGIDGNLGFDNEPNYAMDPNNRAQPGMQDFVGIALHEISEALGRRTDGWSPVGTWGVAALFEYSAPGSLALNGSHSYFSVDGGVTNLGNFSTMDEVSDWDHATTGIDAFRGGATLNTVSPITPRDQIYMAALGFTEGPGVGLGLPRIIQTDTNSLGSTSLTEAATEYFLYNSIGSGPYLKSGGAVVLAGVSFPGWVPTGAVLTATGYDVAWERPGANQFTVWSTDSDGNYIANIIGTVAGGDFTLQSFETTFHQDLNHDGTIGPTASATGNQNGTTTTQGVNADGTTWVKVIDTSNTASWFDYLTTHDNLGRTTSILYDNRDGGHVIYNYDVNNQQRYADVVYYEDSQWRIYNVVYDIRDGTHKIYETNLGTGTYTSTVSDFDRSWNRTDVLYHNRDGTHTDYTYDVTNTQTYSSIATNFTSSWVRTDVTYVERDGTLVGYHYSSPVILDLDGNGVDVIPLTNSTTHFDLTGNGQSSLTAWVGGHDGLLAIDLGANGQAGPDGVIDQAKEINFTLGAPGTFSDLDALRQVFDTNHDGILDQGDARWSEFRIWTDGNQDGLSQPSELHSLDALGIVGINLTRSGEAVYLADGSTIAGTSSFLKADGTTGVVGDVILASVEVSQSPNPALPQDNFVFREGTPSAPVAPSEEILTSTAHFAVDVLNSPSPQLHAAEFPANGDVPPVSMDDLKHTAAHDYHLV